MTFLWSLNGGQDSKFSPTFGGIQHSEFYIRQNVVQNVTFSILIINPILVRLEHRNPPCAMLGIGVPEHLRVAERVRPDIDHRVVCEACERVAAVVRVRDLLNLGARGVEGVDRDDAIYLVREETGCVVDVDDCRAAEHL